MVDIGLFVGLAIIGTFCGYHRILILFCLGSCWGHLAWNNSRWWCDSSHSQVTHQQVCKGLRIGNYWDLLRLSQDIDSILSW
nr:hypothetical protein CFP56_51636 [Quercus suber]